MKPSLPNLKILAMAAVFGALAACASVPPPTIRRNADPGVAIAKSMDRTAPDSQATEASELPAQPVIRRGNGQAINAAAAAAPLPTLDGTGGVARFNFEGESLHAVVKAILGDMLGQNYVIAPGV